MAHTFVASAASIFSSRQEVSRKTEFLNPAGLKPRQFASVLTFLCVTAACLAQNQSLPSAPEPAANSNAKQQAVETIPAGTRFALVLTNPISSNTVHPGDDIHAQLTAPIAAGDHVVIPEGTFVQGKLDRLRRDGSRGEIMLQSASVIFPDGYVAHIPGPIHIGTDEFTAWSNPGTGTKVGAILAPAAGAGIGAAIGSAAHTTTSSTLGNTTLTTSSPKGIAIGSGVGLGVGALVSIILLTHSHQFFLDVGSPMEMVLHQPLVLSENQVDDAVRAAQQNPASIPTAAPRPLPTASVNHGTCFLPGSPETPPTFIPGTPSIGGVPGTPGTTIPGTPPTPPTPYPCP